MLSTFKQVKLQEGNLWASLGVKGMNSNKNHVSVNVLIGKRVRIIGEVLIIWH